MQKISHQPQSFFKVLATTDKSQLAEMVLAVGEATGATHNNHPDSDQWVFVVTGEALAVVEQEEVNVKAGEWLLIEAGENHEIRNVGTTDLKTFSLYAPAEY